jgi:RsiW-degrading membrane proteinase PrsW (M82 family)
MIALNLIFGLLPSLLWLSFYLREDVKPEPKKLILLIFFLGFLSTLPAIFFQFLFLKFLPSTAISPLFFNFIKYFFIVALIEEFFKFFVVATFIFGHPEFEEAVDGMIYMIVSALGFAAAENVLLSLDLVSFTEILGVSILRFLSGTFLHALSSGILGYFLAVYYFKERKWNLLLVGLLLATFLHGLYNFSIIMIERGWQIFFPFLILLSSAIFVSFLFQRLKGIKLKR